MCICSVCVRKSMLLSVKYIYEQSQTTKILGNVIVMRYQIYMVMERLIPHSNVTDMIKLTKIRLWTTKGKQKDSKRVPFSQENFVGGKIRVPVHLV